MAEQQQFNDFIVEQLDNARKFAKLYVKDSHDADDVVSESVEKALRKIHTLKNPDMMKTWFYRIIINTSVSHIRKQSKSVQLSENLPLYYTDDFSRLDFEDMLNILPVSDRKIVSLRFCDNRELKEIAEILGMNKNSVKTRLYRSLKKLKLEISGNRVTVRNTNPSAKSLMILVLALLLSAACVFNFSPTLARAAYEIPVIGDFVRIITVFRFEYADGGYEAGIIVPEIQGLLDPVLEENLNAEFHENADELIRSFEETILAAEELGIDSAMMSIKADYAVKTNNDKILALDTWLYSDINGFMLRKLYTIDKKTGRLLSLEDLFNPGADYITPVSAYIASEMRRLNEEEDALFDVSDTLFAGFTAIRPDQSFYISRENELVICFDKYEVAAGVQGSPEFVIPHDVIKDIFIQSIL